MGDGNDSITGYSSPTPHGEAGDDYVHAYAGTTLDGGPGTTPCTVATAITRCGVGVLLGTP